MTESTREPQPKPLPTKLFLETSAQLQRLVGTDKMQEGINALIYAEPKPAIGTSAAVKREFERICDGVFQKLEEAARTLHKPPAAFVPFDDLLLEIKRQVGQYYPSEPELLIFIYTKLSAKFGRELFTINRVRAVFDALKNQLKLGFLEDELFDKSSCGVWDQGFCSCDSMPGGRCRLEEIVVENRENFIASATTLAGANREESPRLQKILDRLKATEGKALGALLGKNRAAVVNLIIFWEVPDEWTILSRKLTFKILEAEHRPTVDFFMARLPRITSNTSCTIRIDGMETEVEGKLLNHNAEGARIRAPSVVVETGQRVTVTSQDLSGERTGEVSEFDLESDKSNFGLKFLKA